MGSSLCFLLLFSGLWTLSLCLTHEFHLVNEKKTWTEAQKYCRENNTDLATIESQKEMDVLIATSSPSKKSWIGLFRPKDPLDNSTWEWSDGSNSSYRDWYPGEPSNGPGEDCVQLWNNNQWNNAHCSQLNPFVCYKNISLTLVNETKTWKDALKYCRTHHVDLVSVHNETIQQWVKTAVNYASTANVWLGLRHTCTFSFWFWVSGESLCYQNWALRNGMELEDCTGGERSGAIQSGSKEWISLSENQKLNFICTDEEM
ncbi:C-type mannose receptor 2-like [Hoplias malabaricus]|uniref:C-type mannose receptor 2-like n=1 Tax=Hoplias malabaricus TaxID=27720 RepID=UPI003462A644